jgi:hypothetical protein
VEKRGEPPEKEPPTKSEKRRSITRKKSRKKGGEQKVSPQEQERIRSEEKQGNAQERKEVPQAWKNRENPPRGSRVTAPIAHPSENKKKPMRQSVIVSGKRESSGKGGTTQTIFNVGEKRRARRSRGEAVEKRAPSQERTTELRRESSRRRRQKGL